MRLIRYVAYAITIFFHVTTAFSQQAVSTSDSQNPIQAEEVEQPSTPNIEPAPEKVVPATEVVAPATKPTAQEESIPVETSESNLAEPAIPSGQVEQPVEIETKQSTASKAKSLKQPQDPATAKVNAGETKPAISNQTNPQQATEKKNPQPEQVKTPQESTANKEPTIATPSSVTPKKNEDQTAVPVDSVKKPTKTSQVNDDPPNKAPLKSSNSKKKYSPRFSFKNALLKRDKNSGIYSGLALGQNFSSAEFLTSGQGLAVFAEYRHTSYWGAFFQVGTGLLSTQEKVLSATTTSGQSVTINQKNGNTLGYMNYTMGLHFYYPIKKLTPSLGFNYTLGSLTGPDYSLSRTGGFGFDFGFWYQVMNRLEAGMQFNYQFSTIDQVSKNGEVFNLNQIASANGTGLALSVRYHIF